MRDFFQIITTLGVVNLVLATPPLAIVLALCPLTAQAQTLVPAGRVVVESDLEGFGGLSGIEVYPDGNFLTISDRGKFFSGTITRVGGIIESVTISSPLPILDSQGMPLDKRNTDAEGLAVGPDGTIYISFESNNRVMQHTTLDVAAEFLPKHEDFRTLQNNSGLEALAINAEGVLLAIPERSGKKDRPFPVYLFDGENWSQPTSAPRIGNYLVTGADFGPYGRLYLLERSFKMLAGFSTRIRRFSFLDGKLTNPETIFESRADKLNNIEGISVWLDLDGQTRLTIVSDDNFNPLQRTVIAEYLVTD